MTTTTTPPPTASAAASSDLDLEILFVFGEKYSMEAAVGYKKLAFSVFTWGYLTVLLRSFSLSLFTGDDTDEDVTSLRAAI